MACWVLPDTGVPESRSSVQRLALLDKGVEADLSRMLLCTPKNGERFKDDTTMGERIQTKY